jgi:hypothetical protein
MFSPLLTSRHVRARLRQQATELKSLPAERPLTTRFALAHGLAQDDNRAAVTMKNVLIGTFISRRHVGTLW